MTIKTEQKTQTTLSIDKETKNLASRKAAHQHMSVSAVARILLRDYASGKLEIGSQVIQRDINGFSKQASNKLNNIIQKSKDPNNLSPAFNNIEDAITYLHE
jgi:hypothetical protein